MNLLHLLCTTMQFGWKARVAHVDFAMPLLHMRALHVYSTKTVDYWWT